MANLEVDWNKLGADLGDTAKDLLSGMLDGAQEDLEVYGKEILASMVDAAKGGDESRLGELREQVKVLAEVHRIRLVRGTWDFVGKIVAALVKSAMGALGAARIAA